MTGEVILCIVENITWGFTWKIYGHKYSDVDHRAGICITFKLQLSRFEVDLSSFAIATA